MSYEKKAEREVGCPTCVRTIADLKERAKFWECSHPTCPRRRGQSSLDGFTHFTVRATNQMGQPITSTGCFKSEPTNREE
jgi:ribosomal protein L37AE/L43A